MKFYPSQVARVAMVGLLAFSVALPSVAQAASATPKATGKAKVNTVALPSVSAHAGVAPVIGKPHGAAPTKLITKDIIVGKGKAAVSSSTVTAQYVVMSWKTGVVYQTSWTAQPFTAVSISLPSLINIVVASLLSIRRSLAPPPKGRSADNLSEMQFSYFEMRVTGIDLPHGNRENWAMTSSVVIRERAI